MEKLVLEEGEDPNSIDYDTSKCPAELVSDFILEDSGYGFMGGTAIGFFYNFVKKANSYGGFKSRLWTALAKSPCLGGNIALSSLASNLSRLAYFKYTGETLHGDILPYDIHFAAIGGAVGFARYGLRPALLGSLVCTGMTTFNIWGNVCKTRFRSSICKTNTYTYPYYRHSRDYIPWPQASWIQDDSSLPKH